MISTEQANQIANELIEQERARSSARRTAANRRVPRVFHCAELRPLPAWQRREIIDAAFKDVARRPLLAIPAIAWIVGWAAVMWYLPMRDTLSASAMWWLPMAIMYVPLMVVYTVLIRREVRRRASAAKVSAPN